jgi:nitrite reductase/ring-hydroxylating ferredoxin subunit
MADVDYTLNQSTPYLLTELDRIPSKRYYDETFYKAENEKLWPHVWQMACRVEQIQEVGDYIEYSNLGKSVIVVRAKDGIKAYHNACRHRGVALAEPESHGNCKTEGFICPFHGWRWNLEGKNTFVYGKHMFSDRQLDQTDLALKPCRVETWAGHAFINFDDNAPTLLESIGPRGDRLLKWKIDKLRAEWHYATILPANWKTAMEAFMEGYHVLRTHPQLHEALGVLFNNMYSTPEFGGIPSMVEPGLSTRENVQANFKLMEQLSEGMGGMLHAKELASAASMLDMELPEDPVQGTYAYLMAVGNKITEDGRARGEDTPDICDLQMNHPLRGVEFFFPNYFMLPYFNSFSAYRIRPLGPESCYFELWSLTQYPSGAEPPPVMEPKFVEYNSDSFPPIPRQDYANIPLQQIGLRAGGFDYMRLANDIEGLISNYQQVIDGYLKSADPKKLAESTGKLVGAFDTKIEDLGF